jgi:hypothetical protein
MCDLLEDLFKVVCYQYDRAVLGKFFEHLDEVDLRLDVEPDGRFVQYKGFRVMD